MSSSAHAPVREAVRAYAELQPTLREPTRRWVELVQSLLDDAGINYLTVTGRTKSVTSFAAKASRLVDGELLYADPTDQITDLIGVRVITYVHSDVAAVAAVFDDQLEILDDRDLGANLMRGKRRDEAAAAGADHQDVDLEIGLGGGHGPLRLRRPSPSPCTWSRNGRW